MLELLDYKVSGFKAHYDQGHNFVYIINGVLVGQNKYTENVRKFDLINQKWIKMPCLTAISGANLCPGSLISKDEKYLYVFGNE